MKLVQDITLGLRTYGQAIGYIFRKKLAWFFLFPLLLNILLFMGGWEYIGQLSEATQEFLKGYLDLEHATFWGAQTLNTLLSGFIWILFKILFFLIFAYFGGYIIIILLSPVFSFLSERTEKIQTGHEYPFQLKQLLRDIFRGVCIATRNLLIELALTILLFLLSFVPVIGWFSAIILFFVSAYFYGFSFMDYALERKKLNLRQSVQFMRENKGIVIANGMIFSLCLVIPFCGVSLSSFAAIVSVVAGTLAIDEKWKSK